MIRIGKKWEAKSAALVACGLAFLGGGLAAPIQACADDATYLGYGAAVLEPKPANGSPTIVPNQDYYSIFIDSVFLNREETWWNKNSLSIVAEVTVDGQLIPVTIYGQRDPKVSGMLGIAHFGVMNMIPCNGSTMTLKITVVRLNDHDPLKKFFSFANSADNNTLITTYAANALPYLSILAKTTTTALGIFGDESNNNLFTYGPITFTPDQSLPLTNGANTQSVETKTVFKKVFPDQLAAPLHEMSFVLYRTEEGASADAASASSFSLADDGSLHVARFKKGRGMWIRVSIQRFARRTDYVKRAWYKDFVQARFLAETAETDKDNAALSRKLRGDGLTLLMADEDFTISQREIEAKKWKEELDPLLRPKEAATETTPPVPSPSPADVSIPALAPIGVPAPVTPSPAPVTPSPAPATP